MIKVDMWCHFGHAYVTKVDEGNKERFSWLLLGKEQSSYVVLFETNMTVVLNWKRTRLTVELCFVISTGTGLFSFNLVPCPGLSLVPISTEKALRTRLGFLGRLRTRNKGIYYPWENWVETEKLKGCRFLRSKYKGFDLVRSLNKQLAFFSRCKEGRKRLNLFFRQRETKGSDSGKM